MKKNITLCCKVCKYMICYRHKHLPSFGYRRKGRKTVNFTLKEKGTRSTSVKTQKTEVMKRKPIGLKLADEERFLRHLKAEMQKMGATETDYALIHRSMIQNALQNKRTPRDVAWAIMQ